jgi:hypothetical protein
MFSKLLRYGRRFGVQKGVTGALLSASLIEMKETQKSRVVAKIERVKESFRRTETVPRQKYIMRRLLAFFIDVWIYGFVGVITSMAVTAIAHRIPILFVSNFVQCFAPWITLFCFGLRNVNGRSIGQYLAGLQLYDGDGSDNVSLEDGLARNYVWIAPFLFSFHLGAVLSAVGLFSRTLAEYSWPGRRMSEIGRNELPMFLQGIVEWITYSPQDLTNYLTIFGIVGTLGYDLYQFIQTNQDLGDDYSATYIDLDRLTGEK